MYLRLITRRAPTLCILALLSGCASLQPSDPLPSWNDGPRKTAIVEFAERVSDTRSSDYVPPEARIAVFDNDGTLWSEKPVYFQLYFAMDRLRELAPDHPEWLDKEPYASALQGDLSAAEKYGMGALAKLVMATHTGMTKAEFDAEVRDWLRNARHPETGLPYTSMVFQPMLELMDYLRANEFEVWIVSGGGIEFLRVWAEEVYGVPPGQVVGSRIKTSFELRDDGPVLMREAGFEFINDGGGKPVGINLHIGRRPIAAFGNSDGDLDMLRWTAAGDGPWLAAYVHHTDGEREWVYDRASAVGRLDEGLDEARKRDWVIIDMQRDWSSIYPPAPVE